MKNSTNTILLSLFTWGLGIYLLYCAFSMLANVEDSIERGFILAQYQNPLIKYSIILIPVFCALAMFSIPILAGKNIISVGKKYYTGNNFYKAKSNFIIITIFLPTIISFAAGVYFSGLQITNHFLFIVIIVSFALYYLNSIYVCVKYRKKEISH